jgi:hypothetical protein
VRSASVVLLLVALAMATAACATPAATRTPSVPLSQATPTICPARQGAVIDVASEPDWRQYADYRSWVSADGRCLVRIDVLADRPGPEHCGFDAARVLVTGIPVGARYTTPEDSAHYVRDPDNAFDDLVTARAFDPDAVLPADAADTGFREGDTQLWVDPSDGSAVYLVTGQTVERWPLDPDPAICS